MPLATNIKSSLVDAGLIFGLFVAIGGVYSVETRLPRTVVNQGKEGYEQKVKVESGLSGTTKRLIYVLRTRKDKTKWIGQYGGSAETEGCVQNGLDWLVRHQADDGFWSSECLGPKAGDIGSKCEHDGTCAPTGQPIKFAQTGLALLALQAAGNYESNEEKYSTSVRRGVSWLIEHQQPDGALAGIQAGQPGNYGRNFMYAHGMAAFALAESCAVRKAQDKADARASETRRSRRSSSSSGSNTRRRLAILDPEAREERRLGFRLGDARLEIGPGGRDSRQPADDRSNAVLFQVVRTSDGRTAYTSGSGAGSDAMTAVGMLTHLMLLKDREASLVVTSGNHLAGQAKRHRASLQQGRADFYSLYNATLAMFQAGGENWTKWNAAVRDAVVADHPRDQAATEEAGAPEVHRVARVGGRIYSTALATLMLEVYYRFSRQGEG